MPVTQGAVEVGNDGIACCGDEVGVEGAVGFVHLGVGEFGGIAGGVFGEFVADGAQRVGALSGEFVDGEAFQGESGFHEGSCFGRCHRNDEGTSFGVEAQEAFGLELEERLAHRGA